MKRQIFSLFSPPIHTLRPRTLGLMLMMLLAGQISACTPTGLISLVGMAGAGKQVVQEMTAPTSAIGMRQADDPMTVVELYLRQYQPGIEPRLFQTTRIYDRRGRLLAELMTEGRRTWANLPKISQHLIDATIATEDASFYSNIGIDPARIAGAVLQNIQQGEIVSGASTITMQLARNLFLPPEERFGPNMDRKTLEIGIAQELTALYSKDEILEMYLNLLNYGQLTYGPEAAAQVYFGKPSSELTLAEATMIAGIPQQPANLNPYENFEGARQRQRIVLDLMVRHGYLSAEEADRTFGEDIQLTGDPGLAHTLAPHFVQYVIDTLDAKYGEGFTRRSGLNIYTSLDLDMQQLAQEIVQRTVSDLRPRYDLNNAALVAMRPNSGEIMAMVGSANFDDASISGQVNVATSRRQPGSAIKPVLYAAAMEDNLISPATVIWDTPVVYKFEGGDDYRPQNYDERFHGPVTVRTALANSYNVPAVKLLDGVGVERMLAGAESMGIQSLDRGTDWYGLSLTLGGGEITLLELVTAYQTLASNGVRYQPTPVLTMVDNLGRTVTGTITEAGSVTVGGTQVLSPENTFLLSDILSDNDARTPSFGANSSLLLSRPAAVKTGTTTDWRDNWTVGYTRYLSTGVWAGNSDGHPMRNASGITGAAPIWNEFMEAVLADPQMLAILQASPVPDEWAFSPPAGAEMRDECPPGVSCRQGGEYFTQSWLAKMGDAGPLGDSVVDISAAPVYAQSAGKTVLAGYCQLPDAIMRTVLSLPDSFSTVDVQPANDGTGDNDANPAIDETDPEQTTDLTNDQTQTLAWILRNGSHTDLGPCESLQARVDTAVRFSPELARTGVRMFVDLQAAYRPETPSTPSPGTVPLAQVASQIANQSPAPEFGLYALNQSIRHDYACPGQYIMGQVINQAGAPVAGVQVMARDEWGNVSQAVSKNGAGDYGWFDFPITSTTPHEIYVTVLDPAGNPASPTVTVQHRRAEDGGAPCHYLVFQGGM